MSWWTIYILFEWGIRLVMVPVILRRRLSTGAALSWLAMIFALPELGVLIYVLLGDVRLGKRRVRLHREVVQATRTASWRDRQRAYVIRPKVDAAHEPIILQAERLSGMPIVGGNTIDLLTGQSQAVDRLIEDIRAAKHHVHLLYYIFQDDETGRQVAEAVKEAVGRGVECRILADAVGSWGFFSRRGMAESLRKSGVHVWPTLPAAPLRKKLVRLDIRNHRKLAIIDGTIAHTGSHNIITASYGHKRAGSWVDLSVRCTGPVVAQLQTVFIEDWAFETEEVLASDVYLPVLKSTGRTVAQAVPTGPSHETEAFPRVLLTAINAARRSIVITTPYLILDEPTLLALAMAVDRGVTVEVVVPRVADHMLVSAAGRSYYRQLLRAGVRVYRYEPGLLHSKTMTVDESFGLIGSANLDIRSFYLNFEINVLVFGDDIAASLRDVQKGYIEKSEMLNLDQWLRRPRLTQMLEDAAALLSPLL